MLTFNEIRSNYPEALHSFDRFMIREYLQFKILEIIFNSSFSNQLAFLGGTCLRIVHGNQRFSEDLDFDNFNLTIEEFQNISNIIRNNLIKLGYEVEMKNVWKGAYHCYIRFPELLYKEGLSNHKEEKILIQIDTEPHHFDYTPEIPIINKFDVFTQIKATPPNLLLAQKFYAVLNRNRNKGRDFFDIVFLMSKGIKPDFKYLESKLGINTSDELKETILKKCSTLDMEVMAKDVRPFLFNPNDDRKVLLFQEYLKGHVGFEVNG